MLDKIDSELVATSIKHFAATIALGGFTAGMLFDLAARVIIQNIGYFLDDWKAIKKQVHDEAESK